MKKLAIILLATIAVALGSCKPGGKNTESDKLGNSHKVEVKEILQTSNYTYLLVEESRMEQWIAVTKIDAKVGDIFYYDHFMEMNNFESNELGRTFETVYFVQELRSELKKAEEQMKMPEGHVLTDGMGQKPKISKEEIKIEPVEGGITIAELYNNREKYGGEKVVIKGKVTNANFGIMGKNWFHIQDGSSTNGGFDLTVTTLEEKIELGDLVTFEGMVVLNKDFGYGYKYEILMEDAVVK